MDIVLQAAQNFILGELFKKYTRLKYLYQQPLHGPRRACSEWMNTRHNCITIQLMHQEFGRVGGSGYIVRFDVEFVKAEILLEYHMRKTHKKLLNNSIIVYQEVDTYEQDTWEEQYTYDLADPHSLFKVTTLLIEKISKHI